jgi:hypothetical protein
MAVRYAMERKMEIGGMMRTIIGEFAVITETQGNINSIFTLRVENAAKIMKQER